MSETERQIEAYRDAYRSANGFDIRDEITYEKGWFVFRRRIDGGIYSCSRHRRHSLLAMTDRLNSRSEHRQQEQSND